MPNRPDDLVVSVGPRNDGGATLSGPGCQSFGPQPASPFSRSGIPSAIGPDTFRGDDAHLRQCIKALVELDMDGALVPHGIGGHARALLTAAYHRLEA